jgi:hypothetical protein
LRQIVCSAQLFQQDDGSGVALFSRLTKEVNLGRISAMESGPGVGMGRFTITLDDNLARAFDVQINARGYPDRYMHLKLHA